MIPSKVFESDFRKLPRPIQEQVLKALARLRADPYRGRKLHGPRIGRWRWRVGDYRIRYDVGAREVHLHVVRHRKDVYR
ncbi:MAG: type II toxin-antitoxin system RelE/ParE family toxin [Chloroflexi bacterium]|nr:MAG: type II toxin-antitoxin system RelE/ParE family toxin [Chloroflexota bacterium]